MSRTVYTSPDTVDVSDLDFTPEQIARLLLVRNTHYRPTASFTEREVSRLVLLRWLVQTGRVTR